MLLSRKVDKAMITLWTCTVTIVQSPKPATENVTKEHKQNSSFFDLPVALIVCDQLRWSQKQTIIMSQRRGLLRWPSYSVSSRQPNGIPLTMAWWLEKIKGHYIGASTLMQDGYHFWAKMSQSYQSSISQNTKRNRGLNRQCPLFVRSQRRWIHGRQILFGHNHSFSDFREDIFYRDGQRKPEDPSIFFKIDLAAKCNTVTLETLGQPLTNQNSYPPICQPYDQAYYSSNPFCFEEIFQMRLNIPGDQHGPASTVEGRCK